MATARSEAIMKMSIDIDSRPGQPVGNSIEQESSGFGFGFYYEITFFFGYRVECE